MDKAYQGKINIYHLIEGAKQARGLTVIIDVFRAFSLECYLYDMGAKEIRPVGSVEDSILEIRHLRFQKSVLPEKLFCTLPVQVHKAL